MSTRSCLTGPACPRTSRLRSTASSCRRGSQSTPPESEDRKYNSPVFAIIVAFLKFRLLRGILQLRSLCKFKSANYSSKGYTRLISKPFILRLRKSLSFHDAMVYLFENPTRFFAVMQLHNLMFQRIIKNLNV